MCVCLFVCTVTDFSVEDKASGVKFCTLVHWRPRQGMSHFCELCSPRSPKLDELASMPPPPLRLQRLPFASRTQYWQHNTCRSYIHIGCRIGMCGYTLVPEDRRTCSFVFYFFVGLLSCSLCFYCLLVLWPYA